MKNKNEKVTKLEEKDFYFLHESTEKNRNSTTEVGVQEVEVG